MGLRNGNARQLLARIVVMAEGTAQIELALALPVERPALRAYRPQPRIVRWGDRQAARLARDEGCQRQ